jgi:predicted acetylornithine/succinylornithine family transaminase
VPDLALPVCYQEDFEPMDQESIERYKAADRQYLCATSPRAKDIVVAESHNCTIYTADGREFLDMIAGIAVCNVGHCNPEVSAAIKEQVDKYLHTMVYGKFVVPPQVEVAELIAQITPAKLTTTFFTNSGTEAIEGALKLARKYTGRTRFITMERGFHGRTFGSLSVTWREVYRKPFEPLLPDVRFIPYNDLDAARAAITDEVAAVILEPIQGEGGVRIPSDDYLPGLRELCDQSGVLMILDEVQTGFGRTGEWFGCDLWGVTPDILCMAKAMGGGLPLGGFISRAEVMATFSNPPLSHLTTFGGNAVSCAAARAAIRFMQRENLPAKARERGKQFMDGLRDVQSRHHLITDVRGRGLLIGVELADAQVTAQFDAEAYQRGVILGASTINNETVVRLAPPLVITEPEVDHALQVIEDSIAAVEAG